MYIQPIQFDEIDSLKRNTSIFISRKWLSIFDGDRLELHGIFNKNKELIGCFYFYAHKRAKLLTHLSPPPFTPHSGFHIEDKSQTPVSKNSFMKKVQKTIIEYLKSEKYDILSLVFTPDIMDVQEFNWAKFEVKNRYTYQLNLFNSEEDLMKNMSKERRKNILKAKKDGIVSSLVTNEAQIKELIQNTFIDKNLPVDQAVLSKILKLIFSPEICFAYVSCNSQKQPIACSLFVYDGKVVYYLLGGYSNELKHEGAGALSMWNGILEAKRKGVKIFDFEGSMIPSVEKYFRGFGGEIKPYFMVQSTKTKGNLFLKTRKIVGR